MSMISNTGKSPNYAATILRVDDVIDIQGFDRLAYARVGVEKVLVSKECVHKGDIVVFVPQESCLSQRFLYKNNLYKNAEMNEDREGYKGYFEKNGRVTLLKIRGMYSPGFIATIDMMERAYPDLMRLDWEEMDGFKFDKIGDDMFCWKYIVHHSDKSNAHRRRERGPFLDKPKFDYLIQRNFPAHYNTAQLRDAIKYLEPDDMVDITVKIHGTSFFAGSVECNRKLKWWEKILKNVFGKNVQETEYLKLYSSRNVVQNRYEGYDLKTPPYKEAFDLISPFLQDNIIVYGEICGYMPGSPIYIQTLHDYGCKEGEFKFMPYRIKNVSTGKEYEIEDVIKWTKWVISQLPEDKQSMIFPLHRVFHGQLKDLHPFYQDALNGQNLNDVLTIWRDGLYDYMKSPQTFGLELAEPLCDNRVPREGVVIRKCNDNIDEAFKLKSDAHYEMAKKEHDKGVFDIEEVQESQI